MNLKNLFNRNKGNGDPNPMTEAEFWDLIAKTKGDAAKVTKALIALGPVKTQSFSDIYWLKHRALHRWDVWGAGYVINGGLGDDSFHYFKAWLIGKGKDVYETPLDDLGRHLSDDDEDECDNELLNYAAVEAYEKLTGKELDYETGEFDPPAGDQWDEDDLPRLFPKLTEQFG